MEITEDSLFEVEDWGQPGRQIVKVGELRDWLIEFCYTTDGMQEWEKEEPQDFKNYIQAIVDMTPEQILKEISDVAGVEIVSEPGEVEKTIRTFNEISNTIKSDGVMKIESPALGEVDFPSGTWGDLTRHNTGGFGIKHIVQGRYEKDHLNIKDIATLLYLTNNIIQNAKNYNLVNSSNNNRITFEKDDIVVVVVKNWYSTERNWIITGFGKYNEEGKLTRVATDAIKTGNAKYSYALEHSSVCEQVGAVINSINIIRENQKNNQQKEKLITQCLNNKNKSAIDRAKFASKSVTTKNKNISKDER